MAKKKINYRTITALLPKVTSGPVVRNLLILLNGFLVLSLLSLIVVVYMSIQLLSGTYSTRAAKIERHAYWAERAEDYPGVPDVYYNAAVSAMVIGKYKTAHMYAQQALRSDPDFVRVQELLSELEED